MKCVCISWDEESRRSLACLIVWWISEQWNHPLNRLNGKQKWTKLYYKEDQLEFFFFRGCFAASGGDILPSRARRTGWLPFNLSGIQGLRIQCHTQIRPIQEALIPFIMYLYIYYIMYIWIYIYIYISYCIYIYRYTVYLYIRIYIIIYIIWCVVFRIQSSSGWDLLSKYQGITKVSGVVPFPYCHEYVCAVWNTKQHLNSSAHASPCPCSPRRSGRWSPSGICSYLTASKSRLGTYSFSQKVKSTSVASFWIQKELSSEAKEKQSTGTPSNSHPISSNIKYTCM